MDILKKLNKEGQTIILVTHELEDALLADRTIELRDGEIIRDSLNKTVKKHDRV